MTVKVVALDHVQLAMPPGEEMAAETFYAGILGFGILSKPEPLASRGGRWFVSGNVQVHLGAEEDFRPARKAHPALRVDGFDDLIKVLGDSALTWRYDNELPEVRRIYVDDPFGNRLEIIDNDVRSKFPA